MLAQRQWNLLLLAVFISGSLFIAATRVGSVPPAASAPAAVAPATAPAPQQDHPAPDFTLATLDGRAQKLSDLRGKVVLINVWATWCPPCRAEMPAIQTSYAHLREQGFIVLAVNLQEDPRTVAAFMQQYGLSFPALLDLDGQVSATYQARVLPSSFFVDKRGVIRAVYRGPMPRSVIDGTATQLLGEGA